MDKPQFTPGPWQSAAEVQQLDLGESIEIFANGATSAVSAKSSARFAGNVPIAMVMNFDDFPCLEEEKAEDFDIEAQANARVIAAAPSLYVALTKAKETIRAFNGLRMKGDAEQACWEAYQSSPEMKEINAALAMVDGEQDQPVGGSIG